VGHLRYRADLGDVLEIRTARLLITERLPPLRKPREGGRLRKLSPGRVFSARRRPNADSVLRRRAVVSPARPRADMPYLGGDDATSRGIDRRSVVQRALCGEHATQNRLTIWVDDDDIVK